MALHSRLAQQTRVQPSADSLRQTGVVSSYEVTSSKHPCRESHPHTRSHPHLGTHPHLGGSPVIERLMVRGSQVALKHVIHDMEARTLVMELRRRAIKRWVPCGAMDRRLKIPHSAEAECGFRTTPEECLYDSGPIGPSV